NQPLTVPLSLHDALPNSDDEKAGQDENAAEEDLLDPIRILEGEGERACEIERLRRPRRWWRRRCGGLDGVGHGYECSKWNKRRRSEEHTSELQSRVDLAC